MHRSEVRAEVEHSASLYQAWSRRRWLVGSWPASCWMVVSRRLKVMIPFCAPASLRGA